MKTQAQIALGDATHDEPVDPTLDTENPPVLIDDDGEHTLWQWPDESALIIDLDSGSWELV